VHDVLIFMACCWALDLLAVAGLVTAYGIDLLRSRETAAEGDEHLFDWEAELERAQQRHPSSRF